MNTKYLSLSIILPAKNEEQGLKKILPSLTRLYPGAEIIVVNDGSTDTTADVCKTYNVKTINRRYSMGNGASIKTGARAATRDIVVFMDADGQHDPEEIKKLLDKLEDGYEMAVGARDVSMQANVGRLVANKLFNHFASWLVGQPIHDLTSGFRAANRDKFVEFLSLLPNGFSYPTTSTMAFLRSGYPVGFVPIQVSKRIGKSHINPLRDGFRFLLIMLRVCTLYSPLKIFLPFSVVTFMTGAGYYLYTYITSGRFTNMSALLFIASLLIFLIGLLSEQITMLLYQKSNIRD